MKGKIIAILMSLLVIVVILTGSSMAGETKYGPAPNSGDGVPDGSGFLNPKPSQGRGPAPNSGDGIPDGPGW
jgi:hypothetical protein